MNVRCLPIVAPGLLMIALVCAALLGAAPPIAPPVPIKPSSEPPVHVPDIVPPIGTSGPTTTAAPAVAPARTSAAALTAAGLTSRIAPAGAPVRGDGINLTNRAGLDAEIRDTHVEGWSQNIVAQGIHSLTMDNVRSMRAWRDELPRRPDGSGGPDLYSGQALYVQNVPTVRITNYFARDNGWQSTRDWGWKSPYHHGAYLNFDTGDVTIDTAILDGASMAGLQPRIKGKLIARNVVFLRCGVALEAVMGRSELSHCTIYDGRLMTPDGGKSFTGGLAARIYWPVKMDDVWIVGAPDQAKSPKTGAPAYPQGAIVAGGKWEGAATHPQWQPAPTDEPMLTAANCMLSGWPTDDKGRLFIGCPPDGFTTRPGTVTFDTSAIEDAAEAGKLSIADAVQKLHAGIRGGVR